MRRLSHALPGGLTESLADALRGSGPGVADLAIDLIGEFSTLLDDVPHVGDLLERRARVHANGFLKLTLVGPAEWASPHLSGHKLVLHVWDDSTHQGAAENVHDHRWPFWSTLMCGQLLWESYSLSADGSAAPSHLECEYQSPAEADSYELRPRRQVALDRGFIATMSAGTAFHLIETELHKVTRVGPDVAATLFLQGRPIRKSTNVYMPISDERADEVRATGKEKIKEDVRCLPVDTVRQLIKCVLD